MSFYYQVFLVALIVLTVFLCILYSVYRFVRGYVRDERDIKRLKAKE